MEPSLDARVLIDEVVEIIRSVSPELATAEISLDTEFDTLGLGSLELTEVIMELEDRHDVEIEFSSADVEDSLKTVGDVLKLLEPVLKSKST